MKEFMEPEMNVEKFLIEDVVTDSNDTPDQDM